VNRNISPAPLRQLAALIRPDSRDLWTVVAFSIAVGVLALAVPIAAQMLFNYVAFGGLLQPLVVLGITLFLVLSLAAGMRMVISFVVEMLQRRIFVRTVSDLGDRLPRVRADAFDRTSGPEMVNRFFDVLTIQKVGAVLLLDGIAAFLQTTIGLIIVAFYHPFLLGFSGILLAAGFFVVFVLGRSATRTGPTSFSPPEAGGRGSPPRSWTGGRGGSRPVWRRTDGSSDPRSG